MNGFKSFRIANLDLRVQERQISVTHNSVAFISILRLSSL